ASVEEPVLWPTALDADPACRFVREAIVPLADAAIPLPAPVALGATAAEPGFAVWRWGGLTAQDPGDLQVDRSGSTSQGGRAFDIELEPPPSYLPSPLFDPPGSRRSLATFADEFAGKWPELRAISDLASVGLYDLAGPMLGDWYEQWQDQVRHRDATARRLSGTSPEAWRDLFLAARDHHDTARFVYGWWDTLEPARQTDAYRLGYPLAHDRYVWSHARAHDLDPYLVLGLMRQESTYNASARSRVGARGAMQIMPRTGHLLADLAHDTEFDAGDLEDPTVAVGYGIRYLGLLMRRFDGVYPLAVASYNGGPFNVSAWLKGTGIDMPIDAFVEHIPYRETRDYVKKVSEGYAAYVALYGPIGAEVTLPLSPLADRVEVVDF
ncbi:MAG: lytic transglycosylase domain-containing protein, partial [Myxococcota bacterium]